MKRLELLNYTGGEQVWGQIDVGYDTPFKTITAGIFEFGFCDAILQMWASFLYELEHSRGDCPDFRVSENGASPLPALPVASRRKKPP